MMLDTLAAAWIAIQGGYSMPSAPPPPRPAQPATPAPASALPQPTVAAVPGKTLKDLPNVSIHYFDVTGKNLKEINKSIVRQQQADSSGRVAATPTRWAVDASFTKITSGGQCKVSAAKAEFSANVSLPRLVSNRAHKPELLAAWRNYLIDIENNQAANLWFVYDNKGTIERAILASSCEGAQSAGAAAVERLRAQAADFQRANTPPAPVPATK